MLSKIYIFQKVERFWLRIHGGCALRSDQVELTSHGTVFLTFEVRKSQIKSHKYSHMAHTLRMVLQLVQS